MKDDQTIFSTDCVPEGFTLSDPDHLTGSKIIALYSHWWERQRKGLAPFIVLNASPNHGISRKKTAGNSKGKQKIEYVEVDDDDTKVGNKEEEEEKENVSDHDKEMPPAVKIRPPKGRKRIPSHTENSVQVAGPSTVPNNFLLFSPAPFPGPSILPLPHVLPKKKTRKKTQPKCSSSNPSLIKIKVKMNEALELAQND
jgi:hypothetical protein